jgi:hypothetical protein
MSNSGIGVKFWAVSDEYDVVMLIELILIKLMLIELMQSEGKFGKGAYMCEGASGSQKPKKPKNFLEMSQKFLDVIFGHFWDPKHEF